MKTTFAVLLFTVMFWACNPEVKHTDEHAGEHKAATGQHDASLNGLTLNNGSKWDADESTNNQVKLLKETVVRFDGKGIKTLESYLEAGNELQSGIESLIQGCRMQGADHDALHLWLEPLMNDVKNLQKATALNEAESEYILISNQLNLYGDYFE